MTATMSLDVLKHLPNRRGWTRAEFERMAELGLFADEKLELIEGEIIEKMTQNSPHAIAVYRGPRALERVFEEAHFMVRVQLPLALSDSSLPEPDIAVVEGNWQEHRQRHPQTAVLVVEISDTTLDTDQTIKASVYARAGIPEYWIENLPERVLEVHRDPGPMADRPLGFGYRNVQIFTAQQSVAPLAAPQSPIAVADFLP